MEGIEELSTYEQIEDGTQAIVEAVPPVAGVTQTPGRGLKRDGTPKRAPGRKRATPIDTVAAPPPSVTRPPVSPPVAGVGPPAYMPDAAVEIVPEPRKVPFLFTASTLPITAADRSDRAKRHQLLFAGASKLACDSLHRLAPSPNICNPLAALIAMREESEQAHFLPAVATGIAAAQIVAAVVLAKPIGQATQAEITSINAEYAALVSSLGV